MEFPNIFENTALARVLGKEHRIGPGNVTYDVRGLLT